MIWKENLELRNVIAAMGQGVWLLIAPHYLQPSAHSVWLSLVSWQPGKYTCRSSESWMLGSVCRDREHLSSLSTEQNKTYL